ncbi:MAG TPA: glycosyltransferase [Pyrinomonadaceae bacterium]|nr:glycosyltransferase [Pyrinomonadaceae bacterium]
MKLSIIIPAYNEENYLPATLDAINAAKTNDAEVIVVDNQSTDATRDVARTKGAMVVAESERNIAKVRNTGADAASGDVLVFIDADSIVRRGIFEKIADAASDPRCFGGSAAVEYEPIEGRTLIRWFTKLFPIVGELMKMRGGALQFCRADVFRELGGFDATIYVGEDIDFGWRLDRYARDRVAHTTFIEQPKVLTSSRRWQRMGFFRLMFFTHPITVFAARRMRSFWKDWYDDTIR